ncbi:Pumilio3 [Abeliophyllum distichum]|uniref:Pumilio3 n=1 Tax=Abeliophyllum distichum TaxID=126358 RepID=A0ABD1RQI8_9LAMI
MGGLFNHHGGGGSSNSGGSAFAEFVRNKNGNEFMSEEDLRSDPSYSSYYHSNVNLNPRLPPPIMSREDWRFAQRLQGGNSAIGDRRKVNQTDSGGRHYQMSSRSTFEARHFLIFSTGAADISSSSLLDFLSFLSFMF